MGFRVIALENYPRRAHFEYFRTLAYPYAGVTAEVDVTELAALCRARSYSFYLTFLHAAALAANGVPELRQRIRAGGIVEYDECPTSHVELLDSGAYCYCTLHHSLPLAEYIPYAEEARRASRAGGGIEEDADAGSMLFISTLPWIRYTSLIQPVAGGDESNPRITWGRFAPDARGRLMMPVSLLVHHALADGIHIARFYSDLEVRLACLCQQ